MINTGVKTGIGVAGFELKEYLSKKLLKTGYDIGDFDKSRMQHGIAVYDICVGACIAANKIGRIGACLIQEEYSAYRVLKKIYEYDFLLGGR